MGGYVSEKIKISSVATSPSYHSRYSLEDKFLEESIARRGVLFPVVVNGNKETVLVTGYKRFHAARALGLEEISAIRIEEPLRSPDLYLMGVVSNWKQNLSDIDRAFALKRAVTEFGLNDEDLKFAICPALGIAFDRHMIHYAIRNFNLVPEILDRIAAGDLPFRGSQILLQLTDEDQREFARIAESIYLTTNQVLKLGE